MYIHFVLIYFVIESSGQFLIILLVLGGLAAGRRVVSRWRVKLVLLVAVLLIGFGILGATPRHVRIARGQTQDIETGTHQTDSGDHVERDQLGNEHHQSTTPTYTITNTTQHLQPDASSVWKSSFPAF